MEMVRGVGMEGVHQEEQKEVWRLEAEQVAFQQKAAPQQVGNLEGRGEERR